jgi:hypothetical protein
VLQLVEVPVNLRGIIFQTVDDSRWPRCHGRFTWSVEGNTHSSLSLHYALSFSLILLFLRRQAAVSLSPPFFSKLSSHPLLLRPDVSLKYAPFGFRYSPVPSPFHSNPRGEFTCSVRASLAAKCDDIAVWGHFLGTH